MTLIGTTRARGGLRGAIGSLARRCRGDAILAVAVSVLALHLLVALIGPWLAPADPVEPLVGAPYSGPSLDHVLGTDDFGRDVLSRAIHGQRAMLVLALSSSAVATVLGSVLGVAAAYRGGWLDELAMRGVDVMLSLPALIVAMLIIGSVGPNDLVLVLTVGVLFAFPIALVMRGAALGLVTADFVLAARLRGERFTYIGGRELLPNLLPAALVEFSLRTAYAVVLIGGLNFLGFGAAPPSPDWGLMINEGRDFINRAPWTVVAPSLGLVSLVLALNLTTDRLWGSGDIDQGRGA